MEAETISLGALARLQASLSSPDSAFLNVLQLSSSRSVANDCQPLHLPLSLCSRTEEEKRRPRQARHHQRGQKQKRCQRQQVWGQEEERPAKGNSRASDFCPVAVLPQRHDGKTSLLLGTWKLYGTRTLHPGASRHGWTGHWPTSIHYVSEICLFFGRAMKGSPR